MFNIHMNKNNKVIYSFIPVVEKSKTRKYFHVCD